MKLYFVTYDYMIGGRYRPQSTRFFAKNATEARQTIVDNYWERIDYLCNKHGWTEKKARRATHWPFHIEAKRI